MSKSNKREYPVYERLQRGAENRTLARHLREVFGIDQRELQAEIQRERLAGKIILTEKENGGGYWKPATLEEIRRFVRMVEKDNAANTAMMATAKKALKTGKIPE